MTKETKVRNEKNGPVLVFLAVVGIMMLATVMTLVFIVHASWYLIVDEVVKQAIYTMFVLLLYEPIRKKKELRKHGNGQKLSFTYKVGIGIFGVSLLFLYAGAFVRTTLWCVIDWAIAAVIGVAGLVWYYRVYGNEDKIAHMTEQRLWKKRKKMYEEKGLTEAEIIADAKTFLEFYPCGDTLEGDLDLDRPICAEGLTIAEMGASDAKNPVYLDAMEWLKDAVAMWCEKHGKEGK